MYTIKPLPEFDDWLNGLKDKATRIRLLKRLVRVAAGNLGDVKSVGDGFLRCGSFWPWLAHVLRAARKGAHHHAGRW